MLYIFHSKISDINDTYQTFIIGKVVPLSEDTDSQIIFCDELHLS